MHVFLYFICSKQRIVILCKLYLEAGSSSYIYLSLLKHYPFALLRYYIVLLTILHTMFLRPWLLPGSKLFHSGVGQVSIIGMQSVVYTYSEYRTANTE